MKKVVVVLTCSLCIFSGIFLNKSTSCKRSLFFFILVAESENPSPRPPKLRGLSKAKQTLRKGSAQTANGSQKPLSDFQAT